MNSGKHVFAQLLQFMSRSEVEKCVGYYIGDNKQHEPEVAGKLPEEQRTTLYLTLERRLPNTEKEQSKIHFCQF